MILRYKRLVPMPLSGRRASANLVPIPPPASNIFGSSFAMRRIPQLEYRGEGKALFGYMFLGPVNRSFTHIRFPLNTNLCAPFSCRILMGNGEKPSSSQGALGQ